VFNAC